MLAGWLPWLSLLAAGAADGSAPTGAGSTPAPLPDVTFPLLRVAMALGIVLALFVGGAWLVRNWHGLSGARQPAVRLRLLEVRSLGNRQTLLVVGYEDLRFLVAASPAGINLLERLPSAPPGEGPPAGVPDSAFAEALRRILP